MTLDAGRGRDPCHGMAHSMRMVLALYLIAMIAVIIGLDVTLLRHRFWERVAANVGIVLLFAVFYLAFLRRP